MVISVGLTKDIESIEENQFTKAQFTNVVSIVLTVSEICSGRKQNLMSFSFPPCLYTLQTLASLSLFFLFLIHSHSHTEQRLYRV